MCDTIILYAYRAHEQALMTFLSKHYADKGANADLLIICNGCELQTETVCYIKTKPVPCEIIRINQDDEDYPSKAYGTWMEGLDHITCLKRNYKYYYFFKNGCAEKGRDNFRAPPRKWIKRFNRKLKTIHDIVIPAVMLRCKPDIYSDVGAFIDRDNLYTLIPIISYLGFHRRNYDIINSFHVRDYIKPQFTVGKYLLDHNKVIYVENSGLTINKKIDNELLEKMIAPIYDAHKKAYRIFPLDTQY